MALIWKSSVNTVVDEGAIEASVGDYSVRYRVMKSEPAHRYFIWWNGGAVARYFPTQLSDTEVVELVKRVDAFLQTMGGES